MFITGTLIKGRRLGVAVGDSQKHLDCSETVKETYLRRTGEEGREAVQGQAGYPRDMPAP